ncbi:MAG: type VI secretion system tube protein Hcp [Rhizobiales bacterium]|nr:type VI secretion system tube protein Hcp [Hyphomicrobiales bacterium]
MAVDMLLELDGVKGESAIKTNAIDIESWSFGMSQTATAHTATGAGAGKANVQDIHVMKKLDFASPTLMKFSLQAHHIPSGKIICRKSGGPKPVDYLVIEMKNIIVSSSQVTGSNGNDLVSESLALNFATFKVTYKTQKADQSEGPQNEVAWDIAANKTN